MKLQVNWDRVAAVAGVVVAVACIATLARPHTDNPAPGPAPVSATGEHVVVVVDNSSPSIPQGIILDSPQFRALKVAGKCSICDMREEWTKAHGYDKLLTAAGGAPALLVLDRDGGKVYANRLPTDAKSLDAVLKAAMANVPPPLADWPAPRVVDRGYTLPSGVEAGVPYVINGSETRKLTARSDAKAFKAIPRYADHNPTFPVSEWRDVNRHSLFGAADWVLDQDGIGECVACGWSGALRRCRVLAGMSDVPLSPGFLYSLINGGRDQGAVISDGIKALQTVGTCAYHTVGIKPIFPRQMPAAAKQEAARFKLADAYRCDTFEELISAIQTGRFLPVYGVMVGSNFGHFDQYGVCGHDRGPGNHCMHADGCRKLPDGRWVLDNVNSWGTQFGPFHNGRCYLDKDHLFGGGDQPDVCVVRVPGRDPQEQFDPPPYKGN